MIVGECDPRGEGALSPARRGSTGDRMCKMVEAVDAEFDRRDFARVFDLRNLCGERWDDEEASDKAAHLVRYLVDLESPLVLLGTRVRRTFRLPEIAPGDSFVIRGLRFYPVPHPSGLCRAYNDPAVRRAVGGLLSNLWRSSHARP